LPIVTASEFGRVDDDGTVYVKTVDGERPVGQMPDATPEEAMAFYARRFDALALEVDLLHKRVNSGVLSPEEAANAVRMVRAQLADAHAVGDLAGLSARLDELGPVIATHREARRAEKARKSVEAKEQKEQLATEAEAIASGRDWKSGANRLRELLDQWKLLPRIDKTADDALWKRFSSARSAYTKARKVHFAEQDEKRDAARIVKERLAKEAESLVDSTDWGPTAGAYRELMRQWKAAGPAPKGVDDELWKRFRGAQDTFFGARDEANAALDAEFDANAVVKEQLIVEAEALLAPLEDGSGDLDTIKRSFRDIADRWDAAGKVPRDRIKDLEGRMRVVEQAIRKVEDEQWKRTDPEKSARADDMVVKLETAIADAEAKLEKARAAGDEKKIRELEENLEGRRSFLDMAKRASDDYR
jgi:hypothetical protein